MGTCWYCILLYYTVYGILGAIDCTTYCVGLDGTYGFAFVLSYIRGFLSEFTLAVACYGALDAYELFLSISLSFWLIYIFGNKGVDYVTKLPICFYLLWLLFLLFSSYYCESLFFTLFFSEMACSCELGTGFDSFFEFYCGSLGASADCLSLTEVAPYLILSNWFDFYISMPSSVSLVYCALLSHVLRPRSNEIWFLIDSFFWLTLMNVGFLS